MNTSAVFQYFFAIGAGISAGAAMVLCASWIFYDLFLGRKKKKGAK
ncbi:MULTISPECIES: hypothetical protein [Brevibacillus]|nr:hypothetical protein [Brevibacillus halotolerans]MBA4535497.1 hypothetical protein [Brevibacillus halotolerans]